MQTWFRFPTREKLDSGQHEEAATKQEEEATQEAKRLSPLALWREQEGNRVNVSVQNILREFAVRVGHLNSQISAGGEPISQWNLQVSEVESPPFITVRLTDVRIDVFFPSGGKYGRSLAQTVADRTYYPVSYYYDVPSGEVSEIKREKFSPRDKQIVIPDFVFNKKPSRLSRFLEHIRL